MTERTLVVGIGAQKTGSAWLHRVLSAHPECFMTPIKELHYFDRDVIPRERVLSKFVPMRRRQAEARRAAGQDRSDGPGYEAEVAHLDAWEALLRADTVDPSGYVRLLERASAGAPVFGEITPSYALLSEDMFRTIHAAYPRTRFIFVMRDPVARVWSQARMLAAKVSPDGVEHLQLATAFAEQALDDSSNDLLTRSDYSTTLKRLGRSVPKEAVFTVFFEDLFAADGSGDGELARLFAFLGISPTKPGIATNTKVNPGAAIEMPENLVQALADALAPQYDFIRARLGRLPAAWLDSASAIPASGMAGSAQPVSVTGRGRVCA